MYTVKRFKGIEEFTSESGAVYGGYELGSTVYAVVNEEGKCLCRQDYFGTWRTHFYSTKKQAQRIADVFNGKDA